VEGIKTKIILATVLIAFVAVAAAYVFTAATEDAMCRRYEVIISVPDAQDEDLNALIKKLAAQFRIKEIETEGNCTHIRGYLPLNSTYVIKDVRITWCSNHTAYVSAVIMHLGIEGG